MQFREYRRKETITAAEIDVDVMKLIPHGMKDGEEKSFETYTKGDYAELADGLQLGWTKVEFEKAFAPVRAPRQSKQERKPRKPRATAATTNNQQ